MVTENKKQEAKQSLHFVPGRGHATVFLYDSKKKYGFASPGHELQKSGIDQNIFFHMAGFVMAESRYRDEIIFTPRELAAAEEQKLTNSTIFIPLIYRKDDGRFTARQWTLHDFIEPQLTYVTEATRNALSAAESVIYVGSREQCESWIQRNGKYCKGELAIKGPVEKNPF